MIFALSEQEFLLDEVCKYPLLLKVPEKPLLTEFKQHLLLYSSLSLLEILPITLLPFTLKLICDFDEDADKEKKDEKSLKPVLKKMKKLLGDKVKDVKVSSRLNDSPSCIVADENDPTAQMQEMMRSMGQMDMPEIKPILEINPNHDIVSKLKDKTRQKSFDNIAYLLYEQALIQEGVKLEDPSGFVNRLNNVIKETL